MKRKVMTTLYYGSKEHARQDCDTLGIDRRRVISLRRNYSSETGHYGWAPGGDPDGDVPLIAILRVPEGMLNDGIVDRLHHLDDETVF